MHKVLANVYLKDLSDNVSKKTSTSFIEERILANSFNFSELKRQVDKIVFSPSLLHRLVGHKNNISASMAIESFLSHYSAVKSKFY